MKAVNHTRNQAIEDEALAASYAATTLLITADCAADVESLARRVHAASARALSPFVHVPAAELPSDATALTGSCADLLSAAGGGSLLFTDVERMAAVVQDRLIETVACLQAAREESSGVRLMAGTTATLCERIADGTFSERLFYRLNLIHVLAADGPQRISF